MRENKSERGRGRGGGGVDQPPRSSRSRSDPALFAALLVRHTEAVLPYVYTPTVGEVGREEGGGVGREARAALGAHLVPPLLLQACQTYHKLPITPRGLYITPADAGLVLEKLRAWPGIAHISVVVATDGERVLGLGDCGAGGMAIAEGKILLYTAVGGVPAPACLPVALDVGTNNGALLADPAYKGLRTRRAPAAVLDGLVGELIEGLRTVASEGGGRGGGNGDACSRPFLLQFEDFANHSAFRLLAAWRHRAPVFNDDVQGTASVALAALLAAGRAGGAPLAASTVLFYGAGEAGTGIGSLIVDALVARAGLEREVAKRRCVFMDSKGLITATRPDTPTLPPHKAAWAHAGLPAATDLVAAIQSVRPTALVGVSGVGGAFTRAALEAMAAANPRHAPAIFPLSNPTHLSECTFEEAVDATQGRCLFACGSPFAAVRGRRASQANNAFIFPPLGHAVLATRASTIPESAFLVAAEALAAQATDGEQGEGLLLPPFSRAADVAAAVFAAVAAHLVAVGAGTEPDGLSYAAAASRAPGVTAWEALGRSRMVNLPPPAAL